jgi:hypothetical protein
MASGLIASGVGHPSPLISEKQRCKRAKIDVTTKAVAFRPCIDIHKVRLRD